MLEVKPLDLEFSLISMVQGLQEPAESVHATIANISHTGFTYLSNVVHDAG